LPATTSKLNKKISNRKCSVLRKASSAPNTNPNKPLRPRHNRRGKDCPEAGAAGAATGVATGGTGRGGGVGFGGGWVAPLSAAGVAPLSGAGVAPLSGAGAATGSVAGSWLPETGASGGGVFSMPAV
jgi:hypothetical protein